MSRWLNQVNNLLEKLDGQVETVASATTTTSVEENAMLVTDSALSMMNDGHRTHQTPNTTTAVTAAVSVSRAAAVFGSNFVQQATAIAKNNANRLSSLNHNTNNEFEYTDDDEEYDDDDDDEDDEDYEEEDDEDDEDNEDEDEIYTEDEIDFDDVDTDGNEVTKDVVPSIMDNVHSTNIQVKQSCSSDPNDDDDGWTRNGTNSNVITERMENQNITNGTDTKIVTGIGTTGSSIISSEIHQNAPPVSDVPPPVRPPPPPDMMMMTPPPPPPPMNEDTALIIPQAIQNLVNDSGSESVPVAVSETSSVQILEPIKSTASKDRIVIEQQQQQLQQLLLQSVKDQHASELAKLVQQNDIALQQVIHQNEMEIKQIKEHNEKERIRLQQQYDYDRKQLQQQNERYKSQVQGLQKELQAVNQELQDAAQIVEQERNATKMERQEILQEQEEELLHMKDEYEEKIQQIRIEIKDLKLQHENQLMESKEEHIQLGDTLEDELQQMTEKYEEAQITIESLQSDKESIQKELQEWKDQYTTMETNFLNVTERLSMAEAAMITAEERYDIANEQHRKQSQQRLVREAELEQTIAQLLISQQQHQQASSGINSSKNQSGSENKSDTEEKQHMDTMISNLRGQYQIAMEEMETTKTDLAISRQQYMALEQEFQEYAKERQQDTESAQRIQQKYEKQIQALHQQLEAIKQRELASSSSTINGDVTEHLQQLQHELFEAKERMVSLSDQLLRQQTAMDTQKSEISSLKSRLKVAITRAETAEAQQPVSSMEIEFGRATTTVINDTTARSTSTVMNDPILSKRRVKAGNKYSGSGPPRSIRAALGLQQPSIVSSQRQRGPRLRSSTVNSMDLQQQIGLTIDAIDVWMIETGHVLRQEPLARLGFAVYFCMIHLFCFTLVAFHTIEVEHGDLGQLTDHSRVIGLRHQLHQG